MTVELPGLLTAMLLAVSMLGVLLGFFSETFDTNDPEREDTDDVSD